MAWQHLAIAVLSSAVMFTPGIVLVGGIVTLGSSEAKVRIRSAWRDYMLQV
jgi:hypothetical protein